MKRAELVFIPWIKNSAVFVVLFLLLGVVAVTSAVAATFPIATGGAAMSAAFDGTHYLVGIENHQTTTSSIGAQMLNADGSKFGSYLPTGRTGIATAVAFDGTNYLLIWEDNGLGTLNGTTGWQIYGQFFSVTGATVGTPFAISTPGIFFDGIKTMVFGAGKYLVTYTRLINPALGDNSTNRYIAGRIVNPNGIMGSEFRISTGNGTASDVAFDGANFFVIWREDQNDREIRGRFVSQSGVPGTEISVNASPAPSDNPMSVAFDGTNYLVVWNDEIGGSGTGTWDVFGQQVNPSGALVGGVIPISTETGTQMVTSVAFDGNNYLAVWIDMQNESNWDMYGQYLSRNGILVGSKIPISTAATNQIGGIGFGNGKYLILVNNGVIMGPNGISQVADASGMFTTDQYSGNGTYSYSGTASGGTLTWNWADSNFICNGPTIGLSTQTITSLTATTFSWKDSDGSTMTWTRIGTGSAGNISGTWTSVDTSSGNSYTAVFTGTATSGTVSVAADIFHCGINGPPSITSFSPPGGTVGSQVLINGSNFSPLTKDNTVLFNGRPAVVTGVHPGQLSVLVPPGATTGTISVANSSGNATSSTPFTVTAGTPATTLVWGGVHHRIDSDGMVFDALDAGIDSYASSLAGMSLTVSGPNGFSYSFTDADLNPSVFGQLAAYKKYPTPATALQPGVYTFTLNDGQGHISHKVDTHVTVASPLPQVDSSTIQLQRKADGSYRISWAPLNDTKTCYYRVRIFRNDTADTQVYNGSRNMLSYAELPAGILFDNSVYKVRVDASDSPDNDLTTNRSDSAWKIFSPQYGDYDANRLLTSFAAVYNRTDGITKTFDTILSVSDPVKVTSLSLTGPAGFTPYTFKLLTDSTPDISKRTTDGTTVITDFYKSFTAMPTGRYTFTYVANGITHTAHATLTQPVTYPVVDSNTMQAQDLGNGNIRFSWANVNHTGALYYRVVLNNSTNALNYNTARENQTYVDIPASIITTLSPSRWRAEIYDSSDTTTQRNRFNTAYKNLALPLPAYDATAPVINNYRIRNVIKSTGLPYRQLAVSTTGAQSTLTSIIVTGPGGYSRDLLAVGRYFPGYASYLYEEEGTLISGLYTITVNNAAGKNAVRYMYVPSGGALPKPDYTTTRIDTLPNGDTRISWAPVVSSVPVWYSFRMYSQADQDGDGLVDPIYSHFINNSNNFQRTSIDIPAGTISIPATAQVSVSDGSGFSVISNVSHSVFVGSGGAPVADPFATGNDGLAAQVVATNPVNGAIGIATNGPVSVTFNKVIDQRTLLSSFTLSNGITGTISYNPQTRTATLAPSTPFLTGTAYTATISTGLKDQAGNALAAPYTWSFTATGSLPGLSASIIGNGQINGDFACASASCNTTFSWNSPISISASPSYGSVFAYWSGACTGTAPDVCSFSMNANKSVTATFSKLNNVRELNQSGSFVANFDTLKNAYSDNATIADGYALKLVRSGIFDFAETLTLDKPYQVKLSGGFDSGFALNNGFYSQIRGPLTIKSGGLVIENIIVTSP